MDQCCVENKKSLRFCRRDFCLKDYLRFFADDFLEDFFAAFFLAAMVTHPLSSFEPVEILHLRQSKYVDCCVMRIVTVSCEKCDVHFRYL